jgi:hypothetical protein
MEQQSQDSENPILYLGKPNRKRLNEIQEILQRDSLGDVTCVRAAEMAFTHYLQHLANSAGTQPTQSEIDHKAAA